MTPHPALDFTPQIEPARRPGRSRRIVIVANRLPQTVRVDAKGMRLLPSSGGLATGLSIVHEASEGVWIGWQGLAAEAARGLQPAIDRALRWDRARAVPLTETEVAGFYRRFANSLLWPILHGMSPASPVSEADWRLYAAVNRRFADAVAAEARPGDRIWIHDYHLMLVPRLLRERRADLAVGFFLHTPFPPAAVFTSLTWAGDLIDGVLGADAVAFHTPVYVQRFADTVRAVLGRAADVAAGSGLTDDAGRPVSLHASAMSVDVAGFAARVAEPEVAARAARLREGGTPLFVGVDRLDPTKGIPERLAAFGELLAERPDLRGRVRLHQLSVPSREEMTAYRALRCRADRIAAAINARFGTPGWTPVQHVVGSVDPLELCALYRAADVMLVTPLCDGMNLVAKEFVACRTDQQGVLVLSEHAGAAAELTSALLVDPCDPGALVRSYAAALDVRPAEQRVRMRRLRARVEAHDVRRWAAECLHQLDEAVRRPQGAWS
jgi:trehalose 6-phosphate synthase/phosphatase